MAQSLKALRQRFQLCQEFGVTAFEESEQGLRFSIAPKPASQPAKFAGQELTEEQRRANSQAEFRRVATLHTRGVPR